MRPTKSTGHISANIPTDLKRWLREFAFHRELLLTDIIVEALQDFKRKKERAES